MLIARKKQIGSLLPDWLLKTLVELKETSVSQFVTVKSHQWENTHCILKITNVSAPIKVNVEAEEGMYV